jgi:hypothetical protein
MAIESTKSGGSYQTPDELFKTTQACLYETPENLISVAQINKFFFKNQILRNPLYSILSQHPIFESVGEAERQRVFSLLERIPVEFVREDECVTVRGECALAAFGVGTVLQFVQEGRIKLER